MRAVFISRISGLPVIDAEGDDVGKVRDVLVQPRTGGRPPRAKGLVVALFARHRIFIPMSRVRHVDGIQVTIGGAVNTRRFARRDTETLVIEDLFDRSVRRSSDDRHDYHVQDVAMREVRAWDWELSEVALRMRTGPFGRRGHTVIVPYTEVALPGGLSTSDSQGTEHVIAQMEDMLAADVAKQLHDLNPRRRAEVIAALDDAKLADALGELPEEEQVELISSLELERAADILEEMDPDDAADLINDLPAERGEELLSLMAPDEADDVRRLLTYDETTAGGLMTPEPVIVAADGTVADALALVRREELTPALAAMVFVCRSPLDTPTGRFLGGVHIQRLLREPPSTLVSALLDSELEPLTAQASLHEIARYFAVYNLVTAPVIDAQRHLIGAITVDDVLDHVLPADWRDAQLSEPADGAETVGEGETPVIEGAGHGAS